MRVRIRVRVSLTLTLTLTPTPTPTPTPALTLTLTLNQEGGFTVPEATLSLLRALCSEPQNHLMILSGLGRDKVQRAFGEVPNLSLAVEHGFHFRIKNGPWQQLKPGVDISWREVTPYSHPTHTLLTP